MKRRTKENFKMWDEALKTGAIESRDVIEVKMQLSYLEYLVDTEEESMTCPQFDWCQGIIKGIRAYVEK